MKPRVFFLNSALIVVWLAACAPQATQPAAPIQQASPPQAASQAPEIVVAQPQATEAPAQAAPAALATSRGDKLEATDPSTVSLASGSLQLVEFFRFT